MLHVQHACRRSGNYLHWSPETGGSYEQVIMYLAPTVLHNHLFAPVCVQNMITPGLHEPRTWAIGIRYVCPIPCVSSQCVEC